MVLRGVFAFKAEREREGERGGVRVREGERVRVREGERVGEG